jgi:hypothetical protein
MTFTNPTAWFLLLLAIPIILLYILRIQLRQKVISTTMFWQQVFEERRSRSFWRRLRHLISLLLSLFFLFLLVGAILNPISNSVTKPTQCVIIVDNSAGMNTVIDSRRTTRLDQAKIQLNRILATNTIAHQTAIITAGGTPQIVVGFTDHLGTLRRGLGLIKPTDYVTSLTPAIELAEQLIGSEENSLIWIYTDGCVSNLSDLMEKPNIRFFPIGAPTDNIGITRFQPRRSLNDAVGYEIFVETVNFGTESVDVRLEVELDNRIIDVIPYKLEPNQPQTKIIQNTTTQGGLLRATLKPTAITDNTSPDAFPTDNTAIAFLSERLTQHIYLFGTEDFFLLKVLQSQPNIELHLLSELPNQVPDDGVLILHQTIPEKIPTGNVLIIDPRNSCDQFEVGEPLEIPVIAKERSETPFLKFVHLTNLILSGARKLTFQNKNIVVLAETPEGSPVYAYGNNMFVLTTDLKRSDLALRTAFPILVAQVLTQFRNDGGELEKTFSTNEPVQIKLNTTSEQITVISPSGFSQQLPVKSDTVSLGMLPECGIWTIQDGTTTKPIHIACSLSNISESNLRLAPESFYTQTPDTASLQVATPIRFWLIIAALLFCVTEWFLYQRRWID